MTTSPKFSDQTFDNEEYLECHKLYLEQDDIELVKAYDKLARIYFKKYMYDNAIEYFQKAQSILTEMNKANEPEMARLSHNLAAAMCKRGKFDEAIQSFNNAVSILQLYRGKHELHLASTYENLGNTLTMKSSYNEALDNLEKSLELKKNKLGENSPQVGDTLSSMGFLFIRLEDFDKALDYLNKALKLKVNHLGDHFEISAIHEEIAGSWGRKQNYHEAIKSLEKALALKEKYYKKDHYVYTRTYSMLGIASELQGLPDKAINYLNKSIELKRKNLHENHLQFAVDYYYLGRALLSQSKHSEALENFMKCSEIYAKNIGKVNPYSKLINDAIEVCLKKSSENNMCTICLDELRKDMNVSYLQCTHAFHSDCIDSWRAKGKNTCPVCRLQLFDI